MSSSSASCVGVLVLGDDPRAVARALEEGIREFGLVEKYEAVLLLDADTRLESDYFEHSLPFFDDDRVAHGEVVVDLPSWRGPKRSPAAADAFRLATYLTKRERECLEMLVEGLGTAGMARRLGVSGTTVRTHVQSLLTKLGVHSRLEAASLAVRHGLLDPDLFDRSG